MAIDHDGRTIFAILLCSFRYYYRQYYRYCTVTRYTFLRVILKVLLASFFSNIEPDIVICIAPDIVTSIVPDIVTSIMTKIVISIFTINDQSPAVD